MPALTRRLDPDVRQECWLVYYGDVHVGAITKRTGNPHNTDLGNGAAASIRAAILATIGMAPQRVSMLPVRHSKQHGETICPSGAKPTSRNGATTRPGLLRSIAVSIGTSACRPIGAPLADRGRKRSCRRVLIAI
jgi:hypothetical protein